MGATGWDYFVPYEADITAALQRLREDVFARGDYEWDIGADFSLEDRQAFVQKVTPELDPWLQKCKELSESLPEEFRSQYVKAAEEMKKQILSMDKAKPRKKPRPKTIAALLEKCAESGTHSILDILCVASEPEFGAVTPLPAEQLVELFGSETPSHEKIMEVYTLGSLEEHICERWQGIYIIAYRDGSPHEIFFAGCSGD